MYWARKDGNEGNSNILEDKKGIHRNYTSAEVAAYQITFLKGDHKSELHQWRSLTQFIRKWPYNSIQSLPVSSVGTQFLAILAIQSHINPP